MPLYSVLYTLSSCKF